MLRLVIILLAIMAGSMLLAQNAERLLLFHFDATRLTPAEAGEGRLREVPHDGLVLWVAAPAPGKASILYFHGNAGNLAMRAGRFSRFLDHGLGVVAMAYPGSSGSVGEQSSEAIQHLAGDVFKAMPELIGPGPVILYGESLGTGVAVLLAASLAEQAHMRQPAAVVLEAPYSSIRDLARLHYPLLAPWLAMLPEPWPSLERISAVSAPLLILHGSRDTIIPVEMGHALFAGSGATDKQLFVVPGAGHHNVWQPEAQKTLFGFMGRF